MALNIDVLRKKTKEFVEGMKIEDFEKFNFIPRLYTESSFEDDHQIRNFMEKNFHLVQDEIQKFYEKSKNNFEDFLSKMNEEGVNTKMAFKLLVDSTFNGKVLTKEEKEEVGNQMKDVLKSVGFISLIALPGGTLFFILANFLKLNKYILPSAFLKNSKPTETSNT